MRSLTRFIHAGVWLCAFALAPCSAAAQPAVVEARERIARGLALFDEGSYDAALAEFRRAYEIAPNHRVLYNIGRVFEMQGDVVRAADYYSRYLAEASATDPRRREVDERLARQQARIGRVRIETDVPGAEILIDGELAMDPRGVPLRTPLAEPIALRAGFYRIGARAHGRAPAEREIDVAGSVEQAITFELPPLPRPSSLRIRSAVPGVTISVDGVEEGETPFARTIAVDPGVHRVRASRVGYESEERIVEAEPGSELEVEFDLHVDPDALRRVGSRLRLRLPAARRRVSLDGLPMEDDVALVPPGAHALAIEVEGRTPTALTVDLVAGEELTVTPALAWTGDAREQRVSEADLLRTLGWIGVIGGIAIAAGMGVFTVDAHTNVENHLERHMNLQERIERCPRAECPMGESMLAESGDRLARLEAARLGGLLASAFGVIVAAVGVGLVLGAPSNEAIDESASARIRIEPQLALLPGIRPEWSAGVRLSVW
jgi:hypothetical protein